MGTSINVEDSLGATSQLAQTRLRSAKTTKVNRIDPYPYLRLLLIELPKANSLEDIEALFTPKQKSGAG